MLKGAREKRSMASIRIATCQFPTGAHVGRNADYIVRFIHEAAHRHADVVHFSECALCGYVGVDLPTAGGYDWDELRRRTREIMDLAKRKKIWVILGSAHPLTTPHRPHNCVYVIDARGRIVDRYDKRFCTDLDLLHYSPGDRPVIFNIRGIRCGLLICHDVRYPELYRQYKAMGVHVVFQSFYNARAKGPSHHTYTIPPSMQGHSASNYLWSSVANASGRYQSWSSRFLTPDGIVRRTLRQHRSGLMINTVDTKKKYRDASALFRKNAMSGIFHSGKLVKDPRSRERRKL